MDPALCSLVYSCTSAQRCFHIICLLQLFLEENYQTGLLPLVPCVCPGQVGRQPVEAFVCLFVLKSTARSFGGNMLLHPSGNQGETKGNHLILFYVNQDGNEQPTKGMA